MEISCFQKYQKTTEWHWHKESHLKQWNIESRNKPTHKSSVDFNKGARIHNGENTVSSANGAEKTEQSFGKG